MLSYLEKHKRRLDFWGNNPVEQFKEQGTAAFLEFLKNCPNKMYVNQEIVGATYTKRETDFNEIVNYLLTKLEEPQEIGNIVYDYNNKPWLVATNENTNPPSYNRYKLLQCNDTVSYTSQYGGVMTYPCIIYGTLKSKIQSVFKLRDDVIVPQDNNMILIILPKINIKRDDRVVLGERVWKVSNYDDLTAEGLLFLSLEIDKIDNQKDDLEEKIADNERDKYEIQLYNTVYEKIIGETFVVSYAVMKNEVSESLSCKFTTENSDIITINQDNTITGIKEGEAILTIQLVDDPAIKTNLTINIVQQIINEEVIYVIEGKTQIKWGDVGTYVAFKTVNGVLQNINPTFSIVDPDSLVNYQVIDSRECRLDAKFNNKTGIVILKASFPDGGEAEKLINIINLWS